MNNQISDPDVHVDNLDSLDSESDKQLNRLDKHHINIRRLAIFTAIVVIVAIGVFEVYILHHVDELKLNSDFAVVLGVAPIASITVIVTFILIGAFKQSADAKAGLSDGLQAGRSLISGGGE